MIKSIFSYISYGYAKFKHKLWLKILRIRGPNWTAKYYGYRFQKLCKGFSLGKPTVFTYKRPQFIRDIEELSKRTDFNYIVVDIGDLFDITDAFIPKTYGGQVNFNEDMSDECKPFKQLITNIFIQIFKIIQKKHQINFAICANFDCSYDYGICVAAKGLNIKSFVFYYEHPTIPYARVWWHAQYDYYNVKLYADKTGLWSDLIKHYLLDGKVCTESQIVTTGAPRFDRWRDFDLSKPPEKNVVLMAYPGLEYFALCNFIDVIRILAKKSKEYDDHTFWVKCKNPGQTCLTLDYLDGIPDHKLKISHDFDLVDLQSKAKVIIGFNSLSILESMLSNAALITPCWGDANLDPFLLQLDPNDQLAQSVYHLPRSREDFEYLMNKLLNASGEQVLKESMRKKPERDELFSRYFYRDPDIPSSKLFEKMMLGTLEESQECAA